MLIQFNTDPQQILLGNLQAGVKIVATVNMEDIIDGAAMNGRASTATALGEELLNLLSNTHESLIYTINPEKHIINVTKHVNDETQKG